MVLTLLMIPDDGTAFLKLVTLNWAVLTWAMYSKLRLMEARHQMTLDLIGMMKPSYIPEDDWAVFRKNKKGTP